MDIAAIDASSRLCITNLARYYFVLVRLVNLSIELGCLLQRVVIVLQRQTPDLPTGSANLACRFISFYIQSQVGLAVVICVVSG